LANYLKLIEHLSRDNCSILTQYQKLNALKSEKAFIFAKIIVC